MKHLEKMEKKYVLGMAAAVAGLLLAGLGSATWRGEDAERGFVQVSAGTFPSALGSGAGAMRTLSAALKENPRAPGVRVSYVSLGNAKGPLRCFVAYDRARMDLRARDTDSGMDRQWAYHEISESDIEQGALKGYKPSSIKRASYTSEPSVGGAPDLMTRLKAWLLR